MKSSEDRVFVCLGVSLVFFVLMILVAGLYTIIGTYNERVECQKLGIPLYRCQADSIQADVKVGQ